MDPYALPAGASDGYVALGVGSFGTAGVCGESEEYVLPSPAAASADGDDTPTRGADSLG